MKSSVNCPTSGEIVIVGEIFKGVGHDTFYFFSKVDNDT
jgi:CTP-dependent riboflavin kinase